MEPPPYRPPVITQINFQTPEVGYFIWTFLAHAPDMILPLWITPTARAWELRQYLAVYYEVEPHEILLSTFTRPLHIGEDIKHVPGKVVVVHLTVQQGQPGYLNPFIIPWRWNDRYQACTESQLQTPRGAGRTNANDVHDPRAAMMAFALDRLHRECPDLTVATAKFLLRAEARTLTSVLNARNPGQVKQVIEAALKRAELPKRSATPDPAPTSNDEFTLLMQHQATMVSGIYNMILNQPTTDSEQSNGRVR